MSAELETRRPSIESEPPDNETPRKPGALATFSALKHRNFRLFFGGQLISLIGTWMQNTAQGWLVVLLAAPGMALSEAAGGGAEAEARASLYLSLIATASSLPVLFGSLYGGLIADRYSKRRILMATQTAQAVLALILAGLTYGGHIAVWQVILFAALFGLTNVFDIPARQSFVVEMVGKEDLPNAIGLNASLFNAARAFGPALTGILLAALTGIPEDRAIGICFFINGISYLGVIAGLAAMHGDFAPADTVRTSPLAATREVFHYLGKHQGARLLVLLVATFSLCIAPYFVLLPSLARFALDTDARAFGFLMSAQGIGSLGGALTVATLSIYPFKGRLLTLAGLTFPLLLFALAFSRSYPLSCVLIIGAGFGFICFLATANTVLQTTVPDTLRGRVMGLYSVILLGLTPIGSTWAGLVARAAGAPVAIATGALLLFLVMVFVAIRFPAFGRMENQLPERL